MVKITFMGAGSTVFAKNILGDCMATPVLSDAEICLYDIDATRLAESGQMLSAINRNMNQGKATIRSFVGAGQRK
ncbi:MAG: alpha-glucosidase/alpha-galactosidase, partial [Clostridia bacterium]|nr:alpha-glucosidase/alpha-galactosidase [Clostridia bacterium]